MDRPTTRTEADARAPRIAVREAFVLPSRRPALEVCRDALAVGPVLLTGDAGVGKTWLWRHLGAGSPPSRRWLGVDLTPADTPADFYRLVGHGLGLLEPEASTSRVGLVDFLAERSDAGDRPALVVEEAHNLSAAVWEEVRVLANRLGEAGGFAGLVLVGQTPLARRFATRPFAAIESRLAARVHLGPIDADEARELLTRLRPGRTWSLDEVEALHRDAAGNPGRLLRRVGPAEVDRPVKSPLPRPIPGPAPEPPAPTAASVPSPISSLMGQSRPPLIVEDHVIEVGWSPESDPLGEDEGEAETTGDPSTSEEEVRDHYAALQAWREWSENQARRGLATPGPAIEPGAPVGPEPVTSPLANRPKIWADGEQSFAPFGQLFSRMAQPREPD
jgi:type II secretory pathway predicted ATPase ExeA